MTKYLIIPILALSFAYSTAYSQLDENVFRVDSSKNAATENMEGIMDMQLNFNADWHFHLGELPGFHVPEFNDSDWRVLDIPHDWSVEGQFAEDREYAYSSFYQIFARTRFPMRCVQNENFGYIYNFWSDHKQEIRGDATGGLTWRAMIKAAETDPEIAKRVELYKYRVPEEFYDFKNDPDGLVNLVDDPKHAKELNKFRDKMLEMMVKYDDPAYQAFKDRNEPGAIEDFMEAQRAKAKLTKPKQKF